MAESTFCITKAITVRSLHFRTSNILRNIAGFFSTVLIHIDLRSFDLSPSVITVWSKPMKLEPFPYLTGSTWVCSSGKKDEVIAAPFEKSISLECGMIAPVRASELVRDNLPSELDRFGSTPESFILCNNF